MLAPAVAALVLVQLAANAERHDGAEAVVAHRRARRRFTVDWTGSSGPPVTRRTARRRDDRRRWGLGFARIAADLHRRRGPPAGARRRRRCARAVLETGLNRLSLPLALVRDGAVVKATRAWDEETALPPGQRTAAGRAGGSAALPRPRPAPARRSRGWTAGARGPAVRGTWMAIPPDGVVDRARDVLDGMVHERALWDGVPEPARSRIVALAAILAATLGADLVRVPGATWNRRARGAGARVRAGHAGAGVFSGAGALSTRASRCSSPASSARRIEADGDDLYLRIRPDRRDDPLVRALVAAGE